MSRSKCQAAAKILKQSEGVREHCPMDRNKQGLGSCSELPCFLSCSPTEQGQEISLCVLTLPTLGLFAFLYLECLPHLLLNLRVLICPKPSPWGTNSLPHQHLHKPHKWVSLSQNMVAWDQEQSPLWSNLTTGDVWGLNKILTEWTESEEQRGMKRAQQSPQDEGFSSGVLERGWTGTQDRKKQRCWLLWAQGTRCPKGAVSVLHTWWPGIRTCTLSWMS